MYHADKSLSKLQGDDKVNLLLITLSTLTSKWILKIIFFVLIMDSTAFFINQQTLLELKYRNSDETFIILLNL